MPRPSMRHTARRTPPVAAECQCWELPLHGGYSRGMFEANGNAIWGAEVNQLRPLTAGDYALNEKLGEEQREKNRVSKEREAEKRGGEKSGVSSCE